MTVTSRIRSAALGATLAIPLALAGASSTTHSAFATDLAPMIYTDMGSIHVQHEHAVNGLQTLSVAYQFEIVDAEIEKLVERFDPKIRSNVFHALDEHLNSGGSTSVRTLRRIMIQAVNEVLGEGKVNDVLITQSYVTS